MHVTQERTGKQDCDTQGVAEAPGEQAFLMTQVVHSSATATSKGCSSGLKASTTDHRSRQSAGPLTSTHADSNKPRCVCRHDCRHLGQPPKPDQTSYSCELLRH